MFKLRIKKNDKLLVIKGKDRGKVGKVIKSLPKEGKVVVEKVNLQKKSIRARRAGEKGEIVTMPAPIDISKVKIICSSCGKATRIGIKREAGKRLRYCKKCKEVI